MGKGGNPILAILEIIRWIKEQPFYIKYIHVDEKIGVKSVEHLDLMCNQNTPMDLDVFKESYFKNRNTEPLFLRVNERERIKITAKNIRTYFKKLFLRDSEAIKSYKQIYILYLISIYSKLIYSLLIPFIIIRWMFSRFETDSLFYIWINFNLPSFRYLFLHEPSIQRQTL